LLLFPSILFTFSLGLIIFVFLYADDADTNIYRVVASVQQEFGSDDLLELSESQSQSVDGSEQVTQTQDVPFQLAAYDDHILAKIQRAKERRSKLAADLPSVVPEGDCPPDAEAPDAGISEGDALATDISGAVVSSADFPAGDSPACVKKSRIASRKKSESSMANPRRSPRVSGTSSTAAGNKRSSPRLAGAKDPSPSPAKRVAPASRLMKAAVACDPAPLAKVPVKGKQVTGKVKKTVSRSKQVADVKGKKPAKKVGKVVKFSKDSDYVEEDDKDEDEDLTKVSFDKYPLSYFI
jgi:hypothetical protein